MPNRTDNPKPPYDKSVPYAQVKKQQKINSFHIDGGEAYKVLEAYVRSRPDKETKYISPSQLGGCPRAHWFKLKGYKDTIDKGLGTLTTFELGFQYERMMVDAFHEAGKLVHWFPDKEQDAVIYPDIPAELKSPVKPFQFELPSGAIISGTPDFLIEYNGLLTVADSKSARDDSFQYTGPTQEELKEDKLGYYDQTVAYLLLLNKNKDRLKEELGIDVAVEQGLVFIYDKQGGIIKRELLVQPTKEDYLRVADKASLIWKHFKEDTLPPCTCADGPWQLEYCDFGNPDNRVKNAKGKTVNHECCELDIVKANQPKEQSTNSPEGGKGVSNG